METRIYFSKTKTMIQAVFCSGLIVYGLITVRLQGFMDAMIIILTGLSIIYLFYDSLKKFFTSEPVLKLSNYGIENKEYGLIPWSEIEYIKYPPRFLIIKFKSKQHETTFQIITDLNISRHQLEKKISHYFLTNRNEK